MFSKEDKIYFNAEQLSIVDSPSFISDVLDGMKDWVRVIDRNDNILYMNKPMKEALNKYSYNLKCYEYIGRTTPCENCISRKAVFEGHSEQKQETIMDRTFSVMSSPVINSQGEIIAVVEVLRDVTEVETLKKELLRKNKKLQDELEVAKKLQNRLLPHSWKHPKIDFHLFYEPCEKLGGDFFDIYTIDEDRIGFYISDVSGHGVPASMLTVFIKSILDKNCLSPSEVLWKLYKEFNINNFDKNLYVSIFHAVLNIKTYKLTYSNAGLNTSPILLGNGKIEYLRTSGIPISNWVDKPEYFDKIAELRKGDKLFMFTDGIVEIKNKNGIQYGEEKMLEILQDSAISIDQKLDAIYKNAFVFNTASQNLNMNDDITMALITIK